MGTRGLGRGFESLIPTELVDDEFDPTFEEDNSQLSEIAVEKLMRDESQPRKDFDQEALEALAKSIKEHGVLQPLVATREGDKYRIVAGERRWRAAQLAELKTVPVLVRTMDSQKRLEVAIIENAQREDLNAIELATAYAKLKTQFNLVPKEIAERVGKSESGVVNTMRLLNLPEKAKKAMAEHRLSEGVMRPLVTAEPELVDRALPMIIEEGWTARRVERFVAENKKRSSQLLVKDNIFAKQEDALGEKYQARVRVRGRSVTFACKNEQALKDLLAKLS